MFVTVENGTLNTSLLLFYLQLSLVRTKLHGFVEYISKKCFNGFLQSAVDARSQNDEIPKSGVVAETIKVLVNSSYGYQTLERSRHNVKKYLSDKKTHAAINSKLFEKLDHLNIAIYKVQNAKAQFQHEEPIFVVFFLQ